MVTFAGEPEVGLTVPDGEKVQLEPGGFPEHARVTEPTKLPLALICSAMGALLLPAATFTEAGGPTAPLKLAFTTCSVTACERAMASVSLPEALRLKLKSPVVVLAAATLAAAPPTVGATAPGGVHVDGLPAPQLIVTVLPGP